MQWLVGDWACCDCASSKDKSEVYMKRPISQVLQQPSGGFSRASSRGTQTDEDYLMTLVATGQVNRVEKFLKGMKGKKILDINWQNPTAKNRTSLHVAASKGLGGVARLLVEKGAKQLQDIDGCTPADLAEQNGHPALAETLKQVSIEAGQSSKRIQRTPSIDKARINKIKDEEYNAALTIARTSSGASASSDPGEPDMDPMSRTSSSLSSTSTATEKRRSGKSSRPSSVSKDSQAFDSHLWGHDHKAHVNPGKQASHDADDHEGVTIVDGQEYLDHDLDEVVALHHFYGGTAQDKNFKDIQIFPGKKMLLVEIRSSGWCICKTMSGKVFTPYCLQSGT